MMLKKNTILLKIILVSALLGLGGCMSTSVPLDDQQILIKKGMSTEELVELIGEPLETRPYGEGAEGTELWVYEKSIIDTRMISTDLEERISIDPISGRESTVYVNVMSPETKVSATKTVFLIINGSVEAWKVERDERSYR